MGDGAGEADDPSPRASVGHGAGDREGGPDGVTVNQVAPGWTIHDRDRRAGAEDNPAYSAGVPLRRHGTDLEVAHAVAFLASDLASYLT
ncbi:MAG: SDR family oxidoreductase, partial [Verrucomicrobiota bacterium]